MKIRGPLKNQGHHGIVLPEIQCHKLPCKSGRASFDDFFRIDEFKYSAADVAKYCDEAKAVFSTPNAGGSSAVSEMVSCQIMYERYGARGVRTEMQIRYWHDHWKRCDYVTNVPDSKYPVAVSVTRVAMRKTTVEFTEEMAEALFVKKLYGLVVARCGMIDEKTGKVGIAYDRTILHILCRSRAHAELLRHMYLCELDDEIKYDISVLVTVITGDPKDVATIF